MVEGLISISSIPNFKSREIRLKPQVKQGKK